MSADLFSMNLPAKPLVLQLRIAYDYPGLSSAPRPALHVTFIFEDPQQLTQQLLYPPITDLSLLRPSAATALKQGQPTSTGLKQLSPKICAFLESSPVETPRMPLLSLCPRHSSHSPLSIRLHECVGSGRTCKAWRAEVEGIDSLLIVKMVSGRYVASVVRETLFYEVVFPLVGLAKFVPQYYGTFWQPSRWMVCYCVGRCWHTRGEG
jgi:hypothetical protein